MNRGKSSIFLYLIIALAAIGLVSHLFTNTANFFKSIFIMIGVALVMYLFVYHVFIKNRHGSNEMSKYKKAVKQSKLKYKQNRPTSYQTVKRKEKSNVQTSRRINRRASHLRVIDGNKSKRKNRANF